MTKISPHWFLYGILISALCVMGWLWHSSSVNISGAEHNVKVATQASASVDSKAAQTIKAATAVAAQKNAILDKQVSAAKTLAQQVSLVNQLVGTSLRVETPQANTPLIQEAVVAPADLTKLEVAIVAGEKAVNQVDLDNVKIGQLELQLASKEVVITSLQGEVTVMKGGSHWRRFLKAGKTIAVGVAAGVIIDEVARKR